MVDARRNTETLGLSWFRPTSRTSSRGGGTVFSCTRVLVVGGTSLRGRGREAPKSPGALELVEASANIGSCKSACVRLGVLFSPLVPSTCAPPSFYRPKKGGYICVMSTALSTSPRSGEYCWSFLSPSAVEHGVGRGCRPYESSDCAQGPSVSCGVS